MIRQPLSQCHGFGYYLCLISLLSLCTLVLSKCPNQCNGHGTCGPNDKCRCFRQPGKKWQDTFMFVGADCSRRTCPLGRSWDQLQTNGMNATDIQFSPAKLNGADSSLNYLRFYTDWIERDIKRDIDVEVLIIENGKDGDPSFVFKWQDDPEFGRPQRVLDHRTISSALGLQQVFAQDKDAGIYIWFDPSSDPAFDEDNPQYFQRMFRNDRYTFTVKYNYGIVFNPGDPNTAHQYIECSGRGTCDTTTGTCNCDVHHDGAACDRKLCPNKCSGKGVCQSIQLMVDDIKNDNFVYDQPWDAQLETGCKCDPGFAGPDCSLRECPSGADPMGGMGGANGRECSGRGTCNRVKGTCSCFRGFKGERCETQTNFQ